MVDLAARRAAAGIANTFAIKCNCIVRRSKVQLAITIDIGRAKIKPIQVGIRPCCLNVRTACRFCQTQGPRFSCADGGFTITQFRTIQNQGIAAIRHVQGIVPLTANERIVGNVFATNIGNVTGTLDIRASGVFRGVRRIRGAIDVKVQNIVAIATVKGVIPRTARQNIIPVATADLIVTSPTRKRIAASTTIDIVISCAARNGVITGIAQQRVIACTAVNRIITRQRIDGVITVGPRKGIIKRGRAIGDVVEIIGTQIAKINANKGYSPARRQVQNCIAIVIFAEQRQNVAPAFKTKVINRKRVLADSKVADNIVIRAIGKDKGITPNPTGKRIVAGATINGVIARTRGNNVIRVRSGDLIIARTGRDIFKVGNLIIAGLF